MAEEMKKYQTPMLDELEKGEWPSFVTEIKTAAKTNAMSNDLLGLLEQSYNERIGHWKHGGIVGVGVWRWCYWPLYGPSGKISCYFTFPYIAYKSTIRLVLYFRCFGKTL